MSLRSQLSLVLFGLLVLAVGATGLILIADSSGFIRVELDDKHRLLVENRAFALRHNLLILEEELESLASRPELDLIDSHPTRATQVLVEAVQNPDLYNNGVMLISRTGACLWSVPHREGCASADYAKEPWFVAARDGGKVPRHIVETDLPLAGRRHNINIIQPIRRQERLLGLLVGVIALGEDELVTSVLRDNLPPRTEAILVDSQKRILYPPDLSQLNGGWLEAATRVDKGQSGTLHQGPVDRESLLAFAQVGADTPYFLIYRWPWQELTRGLQRQMLKLALILIAGTVLAGALGLWLSSYLTRPLSMLGHTARSLASGELDSFKLLPHEGAVDEIGDLMRAFRYMGSAIKRRDEELLHAAAKLEARVEQRTQELARTQQALINAERFSAMGKAAAAIAHELRNSMGGLGLAVELILKGPATTARPERLREQVLIEIDRLRSMIDALLSFARSPQLQLAPQDLGALTERAILLLEDLASERGVTIQHAFSDEFPLLCDGPKLQSAIMNLLRNAVEVAHNVRVQLHSTAEWRTIEIEDDGPGLSEEAQAHLYEPFFTTKTNGTGIGLATAKRFIEAHGGTLTVGRSQDLGGARFVLTLLKAAPASGALSS